MSEYRIVPKGSDNWGIQKKSQEGWTDQNVWVYGHGDRDFFLIGCSTYVSQYAGYTIEFVQGTQQECKNWIDRELTKWRKVEEIKKREADTSLYLTYP